MPLQATSGAASYDAFGGGVPVVPAYIEEVFSTYLYTGNVTARSITNEIDLAGKGGLVWIKSRAVASHYLQDTARGVTYTLSSDSTAAQAGPFTGTVTSANANGFSLGTSVLLNGNGVNYASWTFREQPKFFDVVTYTGDGTKERNISHALGSAPGFVLIKNTSGASNWSVYHRSLSPNYLLLNSTAANSVANISPTDGATYSGWIRTGSSTTFSVTTEDPNTGLGTTGQNINQSGQTYVAYIFAHNAGGFGLTGTDNVISCGSFTTDGTGAAGNITLGYEAQWLLIKRSDGVGSWNIIDVMRGSSLTSYNYLQPNASTQESSSTSAGQGIFPTATGFFVGTNFPAASANYIYIAIRRGPMKVPTTGTSVFQPVTRTNASGVVGTLQASDMGWFKDRTTTANWFVADRLRGIMSYYNPTLYTNVTDAEATPTTGDTVTAQSATTSGNGNIYFGGAGTAGDQPLGYSFKRAPGFFDEVCYTGTGSARTVAHNLAAVPELMIVKGRTGGFTSWHVYNAASASANDFLRMQTTGAYATDANIFGTRPTAFVFSVGASTAVNGSGTTYVSYLFATCPGVSKVGSYTGTGTTQTINCGFTDGARFVMIKRTDSTGDWYVWDTARGIVAGNDPYLLLNSTAAEVTSTDYVDTASTGFEISSTAPAAINASGGTFIFLAIA